MCSLYPGLEGISDNISVVSIIGRFLEHSRIFWFNNGGEPEVFIGSADLMPRNLDRRVEAVVPIEEPDLRAQLEGLLERYLNDNRGAWDMQTDGTFIQRHPDGEERNSQLQLMDDWKGGALIQPNR
jgi:polyphosphate kinase